MVTIVTPRVAVAIIIVVRAPAGNGNRSLRSDGHQQKRCQNKQNNTHFSSGSHHEILLNDMGYRSDSL
jgi:hypothetical protein